MQYHFALHPSFKVDLWLVIGKWVSGQNNRFTKVRADLLTKIGGGRGGSGEPFFLLHILAHWIKIVMHAKNQCLKSFCGVVAWWGGVVGQPVTLSLQTSVEFKLGCDNNIFLTFCFYGNGGGGVFIRKYYG